MVTRVTFPLVFVLTAAVAGAAPPALPAAPPVPVKAAPPAPPKDAPAPAKAAPPAAPPKDAPAPAAAAKAAPAAAAKDAPAPAKPVPAAPAKDTPASAKAVPPAAAPAAAPAEATPPASAGATPTAAPPQPAREPAAQPVDALGAPLLHHAPESVAEAHQPFLVAAEIDYPHLVRHAVLSYRTRPSVVQPDQEKFVEVEFLRGAPGPYVAAVPAEAVRSPGFDYFIELELTDGRRVPAFASAEDPHSVGVTEDLMDVRERAALERLHGRRSVVSGFGEFVSFGRSDTSSAADPNATVRDWYYRVEGSYTYRPLRVIDEFTMTVGVVRGRSPVPGALSSSERAVGLNYGAPSIRFRLADAFRLNAEFLTSVTEVGFSVGGGGGLDIGDPYGSKLSLGFESIKTFGTRYWSRVDIQATPALRLSPIIEATDAPHADRFGVRLIGEVQYELPMGLAVAVRGGYQARDATSGGPSGGLRLSLAF